MQNGERAPAAVAASCPPWSYHASDQIRVCSLDHSLCGHLTTRKRNPATLAQQRKAGCKGAQEREEKIPRVGVAQKHKVFSMYEVHGLFRTVSERQQNNNARRWQETRELQQRWRKMHTRDTNKARRNTGHTETDYRQRGGRTIIVPEGGPAMAGNSLTETS